MARQNIRRVLAILLAAVLLLGAVPYTGDVQAGDGDDGAAEFYAWQTDSTGYSFWEGIRVITTPEELHQQTGLSKTVTERYADAFFETHYLVILAPVEGSGSIGHRVERIEENGDIILNRLVPPGALTDNAPTWHIVIELCQGFRPEAFRAVISTIMLSDLAQLQTLVAQAETRIGSHYTNVSWRAVSDAVAEAEAVLANPMAAQSEADAAYTALQNALAALVTIASFGSPFPDVPVRAWYFDAIRYVYANGIMQGSGGRFTPGGTLSRAMLVTVLYRIEGSPEVDRRQVFDDVPSYAWYADAILWANENGIVLGVGGNRFNPGGNISRQEMAVMLYNYARFKGYDMAVPDVPLSAVFSDYAQVAHWARSAAGWVAHNQIMQGHGGQFSPGGTATRAECAVMLRNFVDYFEFSRRPAPLPPPDLIFHQIDWTFSIYAEPDFRASRIATFGPQRVVLLRQNGDGWAQISTYRGEYWVFLTDNRRFIERPTGLYNQRGEALPFTSINPQVVQVLAQEGSWLQISTWLGPRWIDLNFTPPTQHLDALLRRHGNSLSVYFENIETGFVYRYNPGRVYHGASVPKAFFSMYIYEKADRGETNLDARIRFTNGGTLTQREMLRRNLIYSCNASTLSLRDFHGTAGFRRWVANLGANPNWVSNSIMGHQLNVDEAAIFAWAIYRYIESDAPHAAEFRRHLLNNQIPFIVSDYPIASKTGWLSTARHDMAIVYADSPYILIVLSANPRASYATYREISMAFQQFNDMWFVY
ncbi:MAG: S-layer homology domain-containing protein [Oscillospiraceae bacterium]|nr:S-layer homology domain-containing protein [Oscillospiraceae bacterium]